MSPAGQSNEFFNMFERADCPNPMVKATPLPFETCALLSDGTEIWSRVFGLTPAKRTRLRRSSELPEVLCLWFHCCETDALQLLIRQNMSMSVGTIARSGGRRFGRLFADDSTVAAPRPWQDLQLPQLPCCCFCCLLLLSNLNHGRQRCQRSRLCRCCPQRC
jgi:hypothetical protein